MKTAFTIFYLFFHSCCIAQNNFITDGPYIFYTKEKAFIETIMQGKVLKDSFELQKIPSQIKVLVPGEQEKFFTVSLKKDLHNEPSEFKSPEKLFVISDIEGEFEAFRKLMLAAGVMDENFNWTFGTNHLVICGDLFDRGNEVTAYLWLLYRLEDLAKAQGGYVHVILGNHDIMNLSEDFRYVHPKYMQSAALLGRQYAEYFAANTELGLWLRSKNVMEKIGNSLFLHGGVSQTVNDYQYSLKKINNCLRPYYDKDGLDSVLAAGKVSHFFDGRTSPFWYRGYFTAPKATMSQVDSTLQLFRVKHIVVGHTIMPNVQTFYEGKVIAVDVNHHAGNHQALLIDKGVFYRIKADGTKEKIIDEGL